jgi:GT2 family glycosyltransferase
MQTATNQAPARVELSVILVNHNGKADLKACLHSLEKNAPNTGHEIIVVDNDSSDGSQEMVRSSFPGVKLITCQDNLGFSRANNLGNEKSRGEYLLFLNPDTLIYPEALEVLLRELQSDPQAGGVGPALLQDENRYQVSFGQKRDFFSEFVQKFILNPYFRSSLRSNQKKRKAGWLGGACLLLRKKAFLDVQGFDEDFFLFFEDIDLCFRLRKKGWKLFFVPEARIFHQGGGSTRALKLGSRFHYRRSQLNFYRKHNSRLSQLLLRSYLGINFFFLVLWGYLKKSSDLELRKSFFKLLEGSSEKN